MNLLEEHLQKSRKDQFTTLKPEKIIEGLRARDDEVSKAALLHISNMERGTRSISIKTARTMARILGVSAGRFV